MKPTIIPREQHNISRSDISKNALWVLHGLKKAKFDAYLVGGGVRDLLLGLHPKDFDIVTDAHPEEIKKIFRNCRIIGKRFRLAHVYFGREIIEVATFRGHSDIAFDSSHRAHNKKGMIIRDNVYGSLEEDVWRRDFTINALYYNIEDFSVVDFVGGMEDLKNKQVKIIGEASLRYHEDPVRMLRAVRIAAKVGFRLSPETSETITNLIGLLQNVSPARLFEEIIKWFTSGKSLITFEMLQNYGLFSVLFPQAEARLVGEHAKLARAFVWQGFHNTDKRISEDKSLNPAFLFAVLLWHPLQHQMEKYSVDEGLAPGEALQNAMHDVLKRQAEHISIPHRLVLTIKEIWILQYRLIQRRKGKIPIIFANPRFRAAYDFLELRGLAGDDVKEDVKWWSEFQDEHTKNNFSAKQNIAQKITHKKRRKILPEDNLDLS